MKGGEGEDLDKRCARLALHRAILEDDLGLKEAADRISRSIGTVKRALKGSMGQRTAYRILKEFGRFATSVESSSEPAGRMVPPVPE